MQNKTKPEGTHGKEARNIREKKKFNIRNFWSHIFVPPNLSHQKRKLLL